MQQFVIEGGQRLSGTVRAAGNKNAALPLLAACLLTDQPVVLRNVPRIKDVEAMRQLMIDLGATIEEVDSSVWRVKAGAVRKTRLDPGLCRKIRASILLAGPMLARSGEIELPPPGGDVIGRRRVDTHLLALEALGAEISVTDKEFVMRAPRGLHGASILLDEASVTGTENAIMAAVLAQGTTMLRNAASEPHVQELCEMLNSLGARIENIGSNTLAIHGVAALGGGTHTIGADYLEVISYVGAAVVTGGELRVADAGVRHLDMIALAMTRMGVHWRCEGDDLIVPAEQPLRVVPDVGGAIPSIKTNVWPAFPTDLTSIAITMATQAEGSILFHDWMYPGRMYFTDKLVQMGARIILCDPHRVVVQGRTRLVGENLESPDIRAGISLVIAALCARGVSRIRNIGQIERGYERIDDKLRALGAKIERVSVE
jgi:UDP-N-acetylglucosamine 1-carboxyvinyltransferase